MQDTVPALPIDHQSGLQNVLTDTKSHQPKLLTLSQVPFPQDSNSYDSKQNQSQIDAITNNPKGQVQSSGVSVLLLPQGVSGEFGPNNPTQPIEKTQAPKNFPKETSKPAKSYSTKCWNKLCLARGTKGTKSRVNQKELLFCPSCSQNYGNSLFCQYCQQIYAQEEVDGMQWIQCETGGCGRWSHTSCQTKHLALMPGGSYFCAKCKLEHKGRSPEGKKSEEDASENNKAEAVGAIVGESNVFKALREQFVFLQSMLTNYSYKLALPDDQIRFDISVLRSNGDAPSQDTLSPELYKPTKKRRFR